jgi:hypothetical protein
VLSTLTRLRPPFVTPAYSPFKLREAVKKFSPVQRAGEDVGKVLQRHLFTLTAYDEKHQYLSITHRLLLALPS